MPLLSYALVTLDDAKLFLGITDNKKDSLLEMLINAATDYIQTQTGRTFKSTTYTQEEYDGTGTDQLRLKHYPVVAFTKLEENNAYDNTDSWQDVATSDYWVENETGIIVRTSQFDDFADAEEYEDALSATVFTKAKNRYRATYSAGYSTIPSDIQYACLLLVAQFYNTRAGSGIQSESLGDHSITYKDPFEVRNDSQGGIVDDILNRYRDIPLAA